MYIEYYYYYFIEIMREYRKILSFDIVIIMLLCCFCLFLFAHLVHSWNNFPQYTHLVQCLVYKLYRVLQNIVNACELVHVDILCNQKVESKWLSWEKEEKRLYCLLERKRVRVATHFQFLFARSVGQLGAEWSGAS